MFDKTINNHSTAVAAVTKEIEKTISPDKVKEMYDAVKEEVLSSLIKEVSVKSNVLNGVVCLYKDPRTLKACIRTHFSLNGEVYQHDTPVDMIDPLPKDEMRKYLEAEYTKGVSKLMHKIAFDVSLIKRTITFDEGGAFVSPIN